MVDAGFGDYVTHRSGVDGPVAVISQGNFIARSVHHTDMAAALPGLTVTEPLKQSKSLGKWDIAD